MQEEEAVQEGEAVQGGEGQALSAKYLASESNILTEHEVETTADRHLSAQVAPPDHAL